MSPNSFEHQAAEQMFQAELAEQGPGGAQRAPAESLWLRCVAFMVGYIGESGFSWPHHQMISKACVAVLVPCFISVLVCDMPTQEMSPGTSARRWKEARPHNV